MKRERGTTTVKDHWRTDRALVARLNARFRFRLDAAAAPENAVCPLYYTEAVNGLTKSWRIAKTLGGGVWLNPPYSRTPEFMEKAREEGQVTPVVCLVPATMEVKWFHNHVMHKAAEIWLFTRRLAFLHPETGEASVGCQFASQLVVYLPGHMGPTYFGAMQPTGEPATDLDKAWWARKTLPGPQ